jgi:osmotically-inducible protein OsmY
MKTDSQVQHDVREELLWEPAVQAAGIGVEVRDGVLTLSGEVQSFSEKWAAELAAQRVAGVKAMATSISVRLSGLSPRTDADIAGAVENLLEWTIALPAGSIHVMVEAGWVTLSGDVEWEFQRRSATNSVRHLMGVTGISNHIGLKPTSHELVAPSAIQAALSRAELSDANLISVAVHGPDITLSGVIRNWAERETATRTAWSAPGVRNVVDMLTLSN